VCVLACIFAVLFVQGQSARAQTRPTVETEQSTVTHVVARQGRVPRRAHSCTSTVCREPPAEWCSVAQRCMCELNHSDRQQNRTPTTSSYPSLLLCNAASCTRHGGMQWCIQETVPAALVHPPRCAGPAGNAKQKLGLTLYARAYKRCIQEPAVCSTCHTLWHRRGRAFILTFQRTAATHLTPSKPNSTGTCRRLRSIVSHSSRS
jgi:hypothetical protein